MARVPALRPACSQAWSSCVCSLTWRPPHALAVVRPRPDAGAREAGGPPTDPGLRFTDVTTAAGIRFRHNNGAFGKKYLPETLGSGVAFLDFDNDGWQDLFFVNSMNWPGRPGPPSLPALYRNNRNGTFTDVTRQAGLAVQMYGLGVGRRRLRQRRRHRHLRHLPRAESPVQQPRRRQVRRRDGARRRRRSRVLDQRRLVRLRPRRHGSICSSPTTCSGRSTPTCTCTLDGRNKSYCTPESYKGQSSTLYRNKGDGTFEDVTRKAGLYDPTAKALGVALIDYDNDGRLDLFVANDTQPNRLYRNKGDGTFADVAMMAGVAFNEAGVARAGMGVDAADYDGSGRQSLVIGNFSNEMMALYSNEGTGLFIDDAPASTVGKASLLTLTFACFFFDVDLDGLLDIFAANGHVADDIGAVQPKVTYAQRPHLFRNLRREEVRGDLRAASGRRSSRRSSARGAAYGDFDNDGDLDLVITDQQRPGAAAAQRRAPRRTARSASRSKASTSNRDAVGARVRVQLDDGRKAWSMVKTGSSYCSQSELPLTFGLGRASRLTAIEVTWPNGRVEKLAGAAANQARHHPRRQRASSGPRRSRAGAR